MSELPNLWALAISQLAGTRKSVQSSCTQSNDARSAQREPSAFLGRRGSETSQLRRLRGPHRTLQRLCFRRFLFFFFLLFKFFFFKNKKWWFFFAEKSSFYLYWEKQTSSPRPLFSIKVFFFLKKNMYAGKPLKKFQAFLSQKVTQFFIFFSTKHFTLKILRFSKYCLKTQLNKKGFIFSFSFIQVFDSAKVVSFFLLKKTHIIYIGNKKIPFFYKSMLFSLQKIIMLENH